MAEGEENPKDGRIFVFGANLGGRHGKGAALHAALHYGAKRGVGVGPQGNAYAIPTKDRFLEPLPLETIQKHVKDFLDYARANGGLRFFVTAIGTGLAGYAHADIAPMFRGHPDNCDMPTEWAEILKDIPEDEDGLGYSEEIL
jgi:hypothetical protein